MKFVRKRVRGLKQAVGKNWRSECGNYRITWRSEVFGVKVPSFYHVCVKTRRRQDGYEYWDFAGRRGPYRKLKAAVEAAEKHEKVWQQALKLAAGERKGRNDRIRMLRDRSRVGSGVTFQNLLGTVPLWVEKSADPDALRVLKLVLYGEGRKRVEDDEECGSDPTVALETHEGGG